MSRGTSRWCGLPWADKHAWRAPRSYRVITLARVAETVQIYFEKETNILHRLDWRSDFYRFNDWKEHDGLKYAGKTIIFKLKDGKPWFFHEVTELERLALLPEGLAKP